MYSGGGNSGGARRGFRVHRDAGGGRELGVAGIGLRERGVVTGRPLSSKTMENFGGTGRGDRRGRRGSRKRGEGGKVPPDDESGGVNADEFCIVVRAPEFAFPLWSRLKELPGTDIMGESS